ncbi:MAG: glycosyltransferase family 39 protein, partial [Solirubrobacteraceae bacterium]
MTSIITTTEARPRWSRGRAVTVVGTVGPVALITVAGAVLRLWSFDRVGANPFYDAAVRSMSLSWHNFFFGAFEPGAQVSVDKAPADLWLQVASVKLFGFTDVAMRVPEVAGGILAIPLLYDLVRRPFGHVAGIAAAATLAVLPAAILTAHSDTMDSVMMALDVLAAWLVVVGA